MNPEHYVEIIERLTRIEEVSSNTLAQATRTNGRVSLLEEKVSSLEITRAENRGTLKTAGIVSGVVSTIFWFVAERIFK